MVQKKTKILISGHNALASIVEEATLVAKVLSKTFGPFGKTVLLDRAAGLLTTKDGVTVARELDGLSKHNLGISLLKEACIKVNDTVGDGTTTTAILTAAILEEGSKLITAGHNQQQIVKEIHDLKDILISWLNVVSLSIEDQQTLERIAFVASNGDKELSAVLAEAAMSVGVDGTISIEDGKGLGIDVTYKNGMEIDRGPISYDLLGSGTELTFDNVLVAVIGHQLSSMEDVQSVMEEATQWPDNPLIIIAENIGQEALQTIVLNTQKGILKCVGINAPGYGNHKLEYLKDIAALSGSTYISQLEGFNHKTWDVSWFGSLKKISIKANSSTLIAHDEANDSISDRINQIKGALSHSVSEYDNDRVKERIAKLSGGLCVLSVGGQTEAEMKERRARIEDALHAVQAGLASGICPGACNTYYWCSRKLDESPDSLGKTILQKALKKPITVLASNKGVEPHAVLEQLDAATPDSYCWDPISGDFRNLLSTEPVIADPTAVIKAVLETAVSTATTLLTVGNALVIRK